MQELATNELEVAVDQLQEIVKPFQQEQNRRQKKSDFLKKCIQGVEKNDFFQVDELLKSKLSQEILEDPNFERCRLIFSEFRKFADEQIDQYCIEFKEALLQLAHAVELPMQIDLPRFSVLKGIEGKIDFANRSTRINQTLLKSIDPRKIISIVIKIKKELYDTVFEPQKFIDSLFQCYKKILKEIGQKEGNIVPIRQLYTEYVWSLQSNAFFQNMDKRKFKGYTSDQFAVDLWRFFNSNVSSTEGLYRIRLNSGRGSSLWLIDQGGERQQITHASFVKS